ncbi:MAG: type II secretion system protein GspM [Woeseiaceae bacterium]
MKAWFESLQARERKFVILAVLAIAFSVVYFGIWRPLDRHHNQLESNVQMWKSAVAELRPLKSQLQNASSHAPAGQNESLVVVVDNTLRQRGLYSSLQRSQPVAQNGIRVEFENAAFDDLVLWLGDLGGSYGLHLQSGSFSQNTAGTAGRVNATVTLER